MSIRPGGGAGPGGAFAPLDSPAFTGTPTVNGSPLGGGGGGVPYVRASYFNSGAVAGGGALDSLQPAYDNNLDDFAPPNEYFGVSAGVLHILTPGVYEFHISAQIDSASGSAGPARWNVFHSVTLNNEAQTGNVASPVHDGAGTTYTDVFIPACWYDVGDMTFQFTGLGGGVGSIPTFGASVTPRLVSLNGP